MHILQLESKIHIVFFKRIFIFERGLDKAMRQKSGF